MVSKTTIANTDKRITYSGKWQHDTLAVKRSDEKGASFSVKFRGRRIGMYGLSQQNGGYAHILLQNRKGKTTFSSLVDMYSKHPVASLKFLSPVLLKDNYTLTVTVVGEHGNWSDKRKNVYGSTGNFVSLDKIVSMNNVLLLTTLEETHHTTHPTLLCL
jgi:hypothetical protein